MLVTLLGMVMSVRLMHHAKASYPMVLTLLPMVRLRHAVAPTERPVPNTRDAFRDRGAREVDAAKERIVPDVGDTAEIVMPTKVAQSRNAPSPIFVTLLGSV